MIEVPGGLKNGIKFIMDGAPGETRGGDSPDATPGHWICLVF